MNIRLLFNTDDNVQVGLPSGKLSHTGARKCIKQQTGMTCTLYAMRRLAFFNTNNKEDKHMQAYLRIKHALSLFPHVVGLELLLETAREICAELSIDFTKALTRNENFMNYYYLCRQKHHFSLEPLEYYARLNDFNKWIIFYDILIENVFAPLMSLRKASWHPRDGVEGLKESLRQQGAHYFMGKFGSCFYSEKPREFKSESTAERKVYYFNKNKYIGDISPFTHAIIVDQVKKVNGVEMVFFRDPGYASRESAPEKIFMLSYETFVNRLTDYQGHRFMLKACSDDAAFGLVSARADKLYEQTGKQAFSPSHI
ncbi:hypothetical protein AQUSIP_01490 [Aquicella siphonis]|uniref:Uncharacterized protein n=1 Tax=Aquicella siphonis TaxID=254247 RepID=A0A5E4PE58_9COXI|nr:hypothetical protein [Aquicella siphonis]VVC74875.1 hypothetical protein AQUSIP_01490 [Aquicella siphonis]